MGVKAPPDNLGARHRALNTRVNEAATAKIPFDAVKDEPESSEVDKLYKIDLAAKYKHIDYIIDILKSGDSLYTLRALKKCQWLFEDEYSHIINPDYLQENIFPFTSMKLKRKIVKTAAARITKPERAAEFFHYCMREKMKNTAFTCLLYTTEDFKLDQLRNNKEPLFKKFEDKDIIYFRFFVGKSFALLIALLDFISINWKITKTARQFKNFFSESEVKYLDIVEKYVSTYFGFQTDKFGPELSDAIMKRHKDRVLTKPKFYVNTVNTDVLVRNSTIDDAKIYAKTLLPDTPGEFWVRNHYSIYRSVFQIIPHDKTYEFFKNYFAENYPDGIFEMHPNFYKQEYYKLMTFEEREEWAYRQLKSEKQILGVGRDYLWYRFIKYDEAFTEIKRLVSITQNADTRNAMVEVLIECAQNDRDLERLFTYYIKRHMNESRKYRESFLNKVLSQHNVFEFDEECWSSFYTILLSMDQSKIGEIEPSEQSKTPNKYNETYRTIVLLYHIIHDKDMPEDIINFLYEQFSTTYIEKYLSDISESNKQTVKEYLFTFYMKIFSDSKTKKFDYDHFEGDVVPKWNRYYNNIEKVIIMFQHLEESDNNDDNHSPRKKTRYVCPYTINEKSLYRSLKKDTKLVIEQLPRAQAEFEAFPYKINVFLRKMKIYFPDDEVTKLYLDMFQSIILNESLVNGNCHRMTKHVANAVRTGVNAIFQLANEDVKIEFMKKYCPVGTKMDRKGLGIQHIRIQRAICRYACISRPPIPLANMLMYMKGDYAKQCLHIFDTYLAILPIPMCQQFVGLVIDAPVSIQKHAIRMAFQCFSPSILKDTIFRIWQRTKNVSLRGVIYKAFFNKVLDTKEQHSYDVLKTLTLDLNQDDEDAIFNMTVSKKAKLPEDFLGDYIEAVWVTINKFKDIEPNITRKKDVIFYIRDHLHLMREEFLTNIINEHLTTMFHDNKLELNYSKEDIAPLYKEKWILIAQYVIHFSCYKSLSKKHIDITQYILRKNIENWDVMTNGVYIHQKCCWDFFNNVKNTSLEEEYANFEDAIPVFKEMLKVIDAELQFFDSYSLTWELRLILMIAKVIKKNRSHYKKGKELEVVIMSIEEYGQGVGKLISELIESNRYFVSFSSKVKDKIRHYVDDLLKLIYVQIDEDEYKWKWKEHLCSAVIYLAGVLVEFELVETYLLAIQLAPTDCNECSSDKFKWLVTKFQDFPNAEVQLSLYQTLQRYCNRKQSVPKSSAPCNIN